MITIEAWVLKATPWQRLAGIEPWISLSKISKDVKLVLKPLRSLGKVLLREFSNKEK